MATYPSKPWTNGQTYEVVPGETYIYDATQSVWKHVTKATLDSDYQVDKAATDATLSSHTSTLSTHTSQISQIQSIMVSHKQQMNADSDRLVTLTSRVSTIELLSDSEAGRVEQQIARINTAFSMLDSDGLNMQSIKTALDAEIAATNNDVSSLDSDILSLQSQINTLNTNVGVTNADHDSDIGVVNATISALAIPIVSATQPTGKAGQLWINTNDNKLYFWNGVDTFVTIATV